MIEIEETRERLRADSNDENAEEIENKIKALDQEVFELDVKPFNVRLLGKVELTVGESTELAPLLSGDLDDAEGA